MDLPSGDVTFCFTDIEGSTQLFAKLGPRFLDLLETHRTIVRAAFAEHGAAEVRSEGDGFFFAFSDATSAARACVDAQRAMGAHPWPDDAPIRIRIGFHSGLAEPSEGDYLAFAVHEAARISSAAHGGQILTSETTAHALDGIEIVALGEHHLKDLPPMRLAQVAHPDLASSFPPLRSAAATRGYVPAPTTELIGRHIDIADLRELAGKTRLLTITGAGGVGKTRVAIELARDHLGRHADGVWFVDLAAVTDAAWVDDAVLAALGVNRDAALDPRAQLMGHLSSRDVLLVIDNCEHLIDACSSLVDDCLRGCPSVSIVATSREAIGIDGEVTRVLRSLDRDESRALFVRRASVIGVELDGDAPGPIEHIVERLDGIPLAIELAAARTRILSPQQIADRLDDRFQLLTGGSRTALARQRTLEATVEWSYDLLDADERKLLERASVFTGTFDLDAIESVCGAGSMDVLDRLVAKSMVTSTFTDGTVRYRMLETIRHFARDKLLAAGEAADYRTRHARYYRDLVSRISDGMQDERESATVAAIGADYANLRGALEWSLEHASGDGLAIAAHLWMYWGMTGRPMEGLDWLDRFLRAAPDADPDVIARAHGAAGHLDVIWGVGGVSGAARAHLNACTRRMRERGGSPRWYEAWALMVSTYADIREGVEDGIEDQIRGAIDVARETGSAFILAHAVRNLAWFLWDHERAEEAFATMREAVDLARTSGSRSALGDFLGGLADSELVMGTGDPVATAREAVAIVFDAPNVYLRMSALLNLGVVLEAFGSDDVERTYEQVLALATEYGADWEAATSLMHLGWAAAERGSLDVAEALFLRGRDIAARSADQSVDMLMYAAEASHSLAQLAQMRGDHAAARAAYLANRELAQMADPWVVAYVCISLGWLEIESDDLDAAEGWFREAHDRTSDRTLSNDRRSRFAFDAATRGMAAVALRRGAAARAARLHGVASRSPEPNGGCPRLATIMHRNDARDARVLLGEAAYEAAFAEGVASR